ncbi:MAG: hypothetical protein K2N75_03785 [Helicobacter sp.]|uniref:hypothetical protein n=1 Tax=Helicobacter sp. TaxID=218 RepID=UPI0023C45A32|nr:hypothetical protein [Helicobacter sp.]MDE7175154.1 hypothetical protein [Helicobacter sp.]
MTAYFFVIASEAKQSIIQNLAFNFYDSIVLFFYLQNYRLPQSLMRLCNDAHTKIPYRISSR